MCMICAAPHISAVSVVCFCWVFTLPFRSPENCADGLDVFAVQVGYWICMHWSLEPSLAAVAVHVAWGQASGLLVETVAAMSGMWAYEPNGWSISLLQLPDGKHLTVLPQAIWLAASVVFAGMTFVLV